MIPHSKPFIDNDDVGTSTEVISSGNLAQGERVEAFEQAFADSVGNSPAVAVSSGTAALHLSLLALGIGKGDEVIIPSFVCSALLNAVNYVGATPILADIGHNTYNIDPEDVEHRVTGHTRAVILPHIFGEVADLKRFLEMGIPIVEDCAQAVGARYRGQCVGSFGTISMFSFYATKVMTTGEGGMVVSEAEDLLATVRELRDYDERTPYRVRYNYKMTDVQAALGLSQLKKLPDFISRRTAIAMQYSEAFSDLPVGLPDIRSDGSSIYYRYVIMLKERVDQFIEEMAASGVVCCRPVFRPIHDLLGAQALPRTEKAWQRAVSIPIYPALNDQEIDHIIKAVRHACTVCEASPP